MALAAGTHLGSYEVLAPLGVGGMGEVYRARDSRLGRDVAIKALPDGFAQDPERVARFEREAKLLASLNHPNVGAIHGLEHVDGHRYLVLELVEGETLHQRLARGPLPIAEALDVCRQIAAALESAHEAGIVHRDLKPGNVMLTTSGGVKVLDFGLAKSSAPGSASDPNLSASPTLTYAGTAAGVIMGTAAYMSPEQARGKPVDKRTDIWSFGCVLYECLSGRRCFEGETVSDLIAGILQGEPDWNALPGKTPRRVRELLRRCLEKDAKRRLRDIGDARIELDEVIAERSATSVSGIGMTIPVRSESPRRRAMMLALAAAFGAAVALMAWTALHRTAPSPTLRFEIADAEGMNIQFDGAHQALSPDGTMLAFVAGDSSRNRLWVRPLESLAARPIAGTDGALLPFWSPDSRDIGFFTETKLKRVPAAGGDVVDLCDVKRARGGTWNRQGIIVFAPTSDGPLFRIAAGGGDPQQVTMLDSTRHESGHRFPCFLPDGRHFTFAVLPPVNGKFRIECGSLDSPKHETVLTAASGVTFAAPGHLLAQRGGAIICYPFDPARRRVSGDPMTLRESDTPSNLAGCSGISASSTGSLAYRTLKPFRERFVWANLAGHETQAVPAEPGSYFDIHLSPDNQRVAFASMGQNGDSEIWFCELDRGILSRVSQEPGDNTTPLWSPDGTRIAYANSLSGPQTFIIRSVGGETPAETYLGSDPAFKELYGWTPDGRALIYARQDPTTRWDLWVLPLDGDHAPRPYLKTPWSEQAATVSPDGRWLTYTSDESGRPEVYVRSFPNAGAKYQVTSGGGGGSQWILGGKQLAFGNVPSRANQGVVVDVLPGTEFRVGPPRTLCTLGDNVGGIAVSGDAQRLLLLIPAGKLASTTIAVVTNWRSTLRTNR
jgi:Tol biopolymer transport system component